jgi:hypothetical protein
VSRWAERPTELANLLNPAFCGFLLYAAANSYQDEAGQEMPMALCVLVLPLVLHKSTRESLPRAISTTLLAWLAQNQSVLVEFPLRVRNVLPYSREALLFATSRGLLRAVNGGFASGAERVASTTRWAEQSDEVKQCLSKARFLGKWLAQAGDPATIYQSFGIQP